MSLTSYLRDQNFASPLGNPSVILGNSALDESHGGCGGNVMICTVDPPIRGIGARTISLSSVTTEE